MSNERFGDIAARLLGGRTQPNPPPDWRCWNEPVPALPIDDLINHLVRSNAEPRLRTPPELERHGITCPFYAMRFAIAVAVDAATATAGEDPAEMAERWRVQEKAARQAAAANAVIAGSLLQSARRPEPRLPFIEAPGLISAYRTTLLLQHTKPFDRIAEDARQWRQFYQRARGEPFDVWRAVFVCELGFVWAALTGAKPARNDEFAGFIEAAYASISEEEVSWIARSAARSISASIGMAVG